VSLGKALNGIASTFEWLDKLETRPVITGDSLTLRPKGHFTVSWSRFLDK